MKIALCSSIVPFVNGGGRFIVEWLQEKLQACGHQVERIYLPQVDSPELLFDQMVAYRWVDLTQSADRIICFRSVSHLIPHPHKTLWFLHHIRAFYDLWDTKYSFLEHTDQWQNFREALFEVDTAALKEAKQIFAISQGVSKRLKHFNNIDAEVLYPPILDPTAFRYQTQNDEILCISRVEAHKRQDLIVEAMKHTSTPVTLRLCGVGDETYSEQLLSLIKDNKLEHKIIFDNRWISDLEKTTLLANCLAAIYVPFDEDYGYFGTEACHASKPIITAQDCGGVTELVINEVNGFVCEPEPKALAAAMDTLYSNRKLAKTMGEAGNERIAELQIQWSNVIERLFP